MTQDEIIRMAREAGFPVDEHGYNTKRIERFAALVAAHEREKCFDAAMKAAEKAVDTAMLLEREACAKVCEEIEQDRWNLYKGRLPYTGSESGRADPHEQGVSMGAGECAASIRDRGEKNV